MNLPRNPLTVAGKIRQCWLFVYRLPAENAARMLLAPLQPVTHGGFAFANIVVCRLEGMRPVPLPAAVGIGYWHVAYRLHAQATTEAGPTLEGLHFLRSDCDRWLVEKSGNLLTDFQFHFAKIRVAESGAEVCGDIVSSDAPASFRLDRKRAPILATGSPFGSVAEAAGFLKYKPRGLSVENSTTLNVVRVCREEKAWRSRVVTVAEADWRFLAGREASLELCCEVEPIDYLWKRGQSVPVKPCA